MGRPRALNTIVTATFPASATAPAGWTLVGGNVYTYAVGDVPAGGTVNVPAVITTSAAIMPGTSIEFGGTVGASTGDANPANNVDNADTSIIGAANVDLSKTSTPATVNAGEVVTYTITITNEGPSDARFVDVKEQLPRA